MLIHLSIRNIVIIEQLELDFKSGMTVLTGETGAGKSILMEALGFTLGERSDKGIIRHGADSAEVTALYDLNRLPEVIKWLIENNLISASNTQTDDINECIIRRILNKDGRSRCFINGTLVPVNQLKELSEQLVNIHGQHQNQALLRPDHQRNLLDEYANHPELLQAVHIPYQNWQKLQKEYLELKKQDNQHDKLSLLRYQIEELNELNLKHDELAALDLEHKSLAHAEQWIQTISETLSLMQNTELAGAGHSSKANQQDIVTSLERAVQNLSSFTKKNNHSSIKTALELLSSAQIQIEEAMTELNHYQETLTLDPARLKSIDERLSRIHTLARKHKVATENIFNHHDYLKLEAEKLEKHEERLKHIQDDMSDAEKTYFNAAKKLSDSRQKFALEFELKVTSGIHSLEMPKGLFKINFKLKENKMGAMHGIDDIEFLVCTNPGQTLQPLRKVASGGELSRISLCIQVITAEKMTTPTLIFDEVDVGISGKTAAVVGKLMRQIGESTQVFCVTHLPQVAAMGHHHFCVAKHQLDEKTEIKVETLKAKQKINEIARMLGGTEVTESAINHAKEMLETV